MYKKNPNQQQQQKPPMLFQLLLETVTVNLLDWFFKIYDISKYKLFLSSTVTSNEYSLWHNAYSKPGVKHTGKIWWNFIESIA